MLTHLGVRGLVLIDALDLPLRPGFSVLTGETGAGKSLVATAVGLLLGRKAENGIVRRGTGEAEVEGLFDVSDEPAIAARLEAAGLPGGDELLVRRVVPADGRQRCFVNGRLASLALLAELAEGLASFSGQHEHLALLDPGRQLELLDDFGGHGALLAEMAERHRELRRAGEHLEELLAKEKDRARRLDWLAFQLSEIEDLSPEPDELDRLAAEASRLRHQEFLLGTAARAAAELYESDGSVYERVSTAAKELERAAERDASLADDAGRLAEAATLIEETARRLADYAATFSSEPGRLDDVESRRADLEALVKKHGRELPDLLAAVGEMRTEVEELSNYEASIGKARADLEAALDAAGKAAARLARKRREAGRRLEAAVRGEFSDLALGSGAFEVRIEARDGEPSARGSDHVELLVALNPGEGSHPIRRVASGGELSRVMLAIRRAVAGVGPVGTYVFDEVDAGIGGSVASAVGSKLREVAAHHQVICITHLPQIAGMADQHYVVTKAPADGRTTTAVRLLDESERIEELARMLGGEKLTDRTRAAARELFRGDRGHAG